MIDKNNTVLNIGDRVVDLKGRVGEVVEVQGAQAVKFEHEGKTRYTFAFKIVSAQIELI